VPSKRESSEVRLARKTAPAVEVAASWSFALGGSAHRPVFRSPTRSSAWSASVSRRTDGAGGRFSPDPMCRSMNRFVSPPRFVGVEGSLQHLARDVLGHVARPALGGVEGDHAGVGILAAQEIADNRFAIGIGGVGLIVARPFLPWSFKTR
jgi:hypothetical protein